jgi:NitT/TauT family transport system substrate-binding protein
VRTTRTALAVLVAAGLVVSAAACSRAQSSIAGPVADKGAATELRLGYFPNVTHAAALIGVGKGLFAAELGATRLTTQTFGTGNEAVSALLGGSLDVAFIGSGPTINAFAKSAGEGVRLVAGATSGGAQLVVRPGIGSAEQLRGRRVASPQLGNTQDIALKKWLAGHDIPAGEGTDDVTIVNADNPQTFDGFRGGQIDAAWLPEPWSSRLVLDAGAEVLVDERDLWPGGQFPTTVVVARTGFLAEHQASVRALLRGLLATIDWAQANKTEAWTVTNDAIEELTGKALSAPVIERAFGNITLAIDPLAATFGQLARDSVTAGVSKREPDLKGLVDLTALNAVLASAGRPPIDAAGLDSK